MHDFSFSLNLFLKEYIKLQYLTSTKNSKRPSIILSPHIHIFIALFL
jgi:hypothetical protein